MHLKTYKIFVEAIQYMGYIIKISKFDFFIILILNAYK